MSTNNITGDKLVSKPTTGYATGYDLIWGKRDKKDEQDIRDTGLSGEARERRIPSCCGGEVCSGEEA